MEGVKVAILNNYKMILPHYGKYNSLYGIFTSEGFVYCDDIVNYQNIVIDEILYYVKVIDSCTRFKPKN